MEYNTEEMTVEQLEQEIQKLGAERDAINEKMAGLHFAMDDKTARVSLDNKLSAMSPAERKLLGLPEIEQAPADESQNEAPAAQNVGVQGIDSEERVNGRRK